VITLYDHGPAGIASDPWSLVCPAGWAAAAVCAERATISPDRGWPARVRAGGPWEPGCLCASRDWGIQ